MICGDSPKQKIEKQNELGAKFSHKRYKAADKNESKILPKICVMFLKLRVDQYNLTRSWQIGQTIYVRNICLQDEAIACISLLDSLSC